MIKVTYIDHMGSDLSVVNAARVSFGKKSEMVCTDLQVGTWELKPQDTKLIRYLAKEKHYSPFNHTFVTFHVKAPIFVARQLVMHEYMPWNEISRRYVDSDPEFYKPKTWRGRSSDKKQGSSETIVEGVSTVKWTNGSSTLRDVAQVCLAEYKYLIFKGVAPEQARMVLPQSTMTEWYW